MWNWESTGVCKEPQYVLFGEFLQEHKVFGYPFWDISGELLPMHGQASSCASPY
jgi:hypothetical protein